MMTTLLIISLIIGIITVWPTLVAPKAKGLRHLDFDRRKALEKYTIPHEKGHGRPKTGKNIRANTP
ncbi:MAG: hypothetical protein AB9872_14360 [Solidesulfovibrio sp.]